MEVVSAVVFLKIIATVIRPAYNSECSFLPSSVCEFQFLLNMKVLSISFPQTVLIRLYFTLINWQTISILGHVVLATRASRKWGTTRSSKTTFGIFGRFAKTFLPSFTSCRATTTPGTLTTSKTRRRSRVFRPRKPLRETTCPSSGSPTARTTSWWRNATTKSLHPFPEEYVF